MCLVLYGISAGLGVLQHECDAGFHSPPLEWLQVALDSEESQRVVLAVLRHIVADVGLLGVYVCHVEDGIADMDVSGHDGQLVEESGHERDLVLRHGAHSRLSDTPESAAGGSLAGRIRKEGRGACRQAL